MFDFDRFAQVATAAVGALVLSTLSITAAIGPVRASDFAGAGGTTTQIAQVALETEAHG